MMHYDFIIFFEHRTRELENVCLIKAELERRGYSVWLSNTAFWRSIKTFYCLKADYVIVPYLYDDKFVHYFADFKEGPPKAIINLQMEQVHTIHTAENGLKFPKGLAKRFYHLCWGERIVERLHKEAGIPSHLLLKTGAIGTDFDRVAFREGDMDKRQLAEKYSLNSAAPWILFISPFSLVSLPESELKWNSDFLKIPHYKYKSYVENLKIIRKATLEWFDNFLTENPSILLIYRPHPAEMSSDDLIEMVKRHPNFCVIDDGSIRTWILACDVLHSCFSTAIVNAYFAGKNCGILRPVPLMPENELELLRDADFITDYEKFVAFSKNPAAFEFPVAAETIKEYYEFNEIPVYKKICDALQQIHEEGVEIDIPLSDIEPYNLRRNKMLNRMLARLAIFLANFIHFDCRAKGKNMLWLSRLSKETFGIQKEVLNMEARMQYLLERLANN